MGGGGGGRKIWTMSLFCVCEGGWDFGYLLSNLGTFLYPFRHLQYVEQLHYFVYIFGVGTCKNKAPVSPFFTMLQCLYRGVETLTKLNKKTRTRECLREEYFEEQCLRITINMKRPKT